MVKHENSLGSGIGVSRLLGEAEFFNELETSRVPRIYNSPDGGSSQCVKCVCASKIAGGTAEMPANEGFGQAASYTSR